MCIRDSSGIKAPRAIPREVVLIGPWGISGGLNSDIVLGFLEVTFARSKNSLIKDVISSDNPPKSIKFVLFWVKIPGLLG